MTETTRDHEQEDQEIVADGGEKRGASAVFFFVALALVVVFLGAMLAHLSLRLVELAWRVT